MTPSKSRDAWSRRPLAPRHAYAFAVLITFATIALRTALTPWVHDRPTLILFTVPIALSAYLGGVGPGLTCTALVAVASPFFVLPSIFSFSVTQSEDVAQWALLVLVGVLLSFMNRAGPHLRSGMLDQPYERKLAGTIQKMQGGLAFALALLIAIGGVSYFSLLRVTEDTRMVARTRATMEHLSSLQRLTSNAPDSLRAFNATGDETFLQPHLENLKKAQQQVGQLRQTFRASPQQLQRIDELANLLDSRLRVVAQVAAQHESAATAARVADTEGARIDAALSALLHAIIASEQQLLAQRQADAEASSRFARSIIITGGGIALLLVGGALLAIRRDFSGRISAEAELERFFSLSLDFLCISSADGYFKRVSPAVTDILGWSVQEFLSKPYLHFIHPDDHAATLREVERQMTTGEGVLKFENRYRHKDGSWRVLSWRSVPQPDGLMYASARDVTEAKSAEQRLLDANNLLEDRVMARTSELARANAALQEQLARLSLLNHITHAVGERQNIDRIFAVVTGTLRTQLPSDFACVLTYDAVDALFRVASINSDADLPVELQTGTWPIAKETDGLVTCLNGASLYEPDISASTAPLFATLARLGLASLIAAPLSGEQKIVGLLLAARRVGAGFSEGEQDFMRQLAEHVGLAAHQAQLYEALEAAYEDLRSSQQAVMQQERLRVLGQMASGIAHDINNSISPVTLYTKMLERERSLSEQGRDFLRIIQQSVRDVSDTVARMREFYRPADPDQAFTAVQLNDLLPQLVHLTRARWADMPQQRGVVVRIQLDLGANLPVVRGIESEIREALTNLIFNAVDAMPDGGTITLRTSSSGSDHSASSTVDVEVSDTGIGMDQQTQRRCLEPFFTTKGERGSGLGLAMVYGIIQRHGGNMSVDSQLGHGTTITLSFAIATGNEAHPASAVEPGAVQPLRIMIVDDDPVLLKALRDILDADGHSVVAMDDGQKAIDAFNARATASEPFDVVITDLGMPHVDGRQIAAAVKAAVPGTPVIMLTGWGRLMDEVPRHVDRLLAKPPALHELQGALATMAPRRRGQMH